MAMIFGHRGARGEYPENTTEGFLYAASLGIYGIEMDVCITADKKVVVSHESWMNPAICIKPDKSRISFLRRKNLYRMNYETIRLYDCGIKGNRAFPRQRKMHSCKPLLGKVIQDTEDYILANRLKPLVYLIEIKSKKISDKLLHPPPAEFMQLVMQELMPFGIQNRIIIQSFDMRPLKIIRRSYPAFGTGMLVYSPRIINRRLKTLGFVPDTCGVNYKYLTEKWIDRIHAAGMKALAWTVNEKADIEHQLRLGADGIISDYPETAKYEAQRFTAA